MLDTNDINTLADQNIYGSDGDKIGTARQVYTDDDSGQPAWVTVRTGLFGSSETFVPLADATLGSEGVTVPYTKSFVKDAPKVDEDGHLSPAQERELYAYYSRSGNDSGDAYGGNTITDDNRDAAVRTPSRTDRASGDAQSRSDTSVGHDTSGPTTDDAMTVSEERLNVGTERHEAGRARLKKYVVTENVTTTVPVQREEVRLEREPITDANIGDATAGPSISEEEHEVVLHEDRPVVDKEAVPVERVRLDTETVTEQETVTDEVRKERVDVDGNISAEDDRDNRV